MQGVLHVICLQQLVRLVRIPQDRRVDFRVRHHVQVDPWVSVRQVVVIC